MDTIKTILKSRTFWTLVFTFVVNVVNAYTALIPPTYLTIINVILTTLATYFKLNPSQTY